MLGGVPSQNNQNNPPYHKNVRAPKPETQRPATAEERGGGGGIKAIYIILNQINKRFYNTDLHIAN